MDKVEDSIFETNPFLFNNRPTLIEYAAFFGSIQIIEYLHENKIELGPSLLSYAIHSNNLEMINLFEEYQINPNENEYDNCLKEIVGCFHNDIANYIVNCIFPKKEGKSSQILLLGLQFHNFSFIQKDLIDESVFINLCEFDYIYLVDILLKSQKIDVNLKKIHIFNI